MTLSWDSEHSQEAAPRLDATASKLESRFLEESTGVRAFTSRLAPTSEPSCGVPAGSEPVLSYLRRASSS